MNSTTLFNVSIVLFYPEITELNDCINFFKEIPSLNNLFIIENSPGQNYKYLENVDSRFIYIPTSKNLGYGKAHNLALLKSREAKIQYHLVCNIDINFLGLKIDKLIGYLNSNPDVGLLIPKVLNQDGSIQNTAKLLPTPFDLIIRRFFPRQMFKGIREAYQLNSYNYKELLNAPFISGCFMFLRSTILKDVGYFDERFFMYCEDLDLSRRIHSKYKTVLHPGFTILHKHKKDSFKSFRMLRAHIWSAILYFNKYGWLFDEDRYNINKETIENLKIQKKL